jgi:hypothetical protein
MTTLHLPGLTVITPSGFEPEVKSYPRGMTNGNAGFPRVIRKMGNVFIYRTGDPNKTPVGTFDPPVLLYVKYTNWVVDKAGGAPLKLGYWDGSDWQEFTAPNSYTILPASTGKIGIIEVRQWAPDPPIAWGG